MGCALCCCGPCDGCYTCACYNKDNCTTGVTGFKDIMKHTMFIGKKIHDSLGLQVSSEPTKTFSTYVPWFYHINNSSLNLNLNWFLL